MHRRTALGTVPAAIKAAPLERRCEGRALVVHGCGAAVTPMLGMVVMPPRTSKMLRAFAAIPAPVWFTKMLRAKTTVWPEMRLRSARASKVRSETWTAKLLRPLPAAETLAPVRPIPIAMPSVAMAKAMPIAIPTVAIPRMPKAVPTPTGSPLLHGAAGRASLG